MREVTRRKAIPICFTSGEARKSESVGRIIFVKNIVVKTANELLLHSPALVPTFG